MYSKLTAKKADDIAGSHLKLAKFLSQHDKPPSEHDNAAPAIFDNKVKIGSGIDGELIDNDDDNPKGVRITWRDSSDSDTDVAYDMEDLQMKYFPDDNSSNSSEDEERIDLVDDGPTEIVKRRQRFYDNIAEKGISKPDNTVVYYLDEYTRYGTRRKHNRDKIRCNDCGVVYRRNQGTKHRRTKRHIARAQANEAIIAAHALQKGRKLAFIPDNKTIEDIINERVETKLKEMLA